MQARQRAPSLPSKEVELLQKINTDAVSHLRKRYQALNAKLLAETMTPDEQSEFLAITDQIEVADADRMQALISLAQLRGMTVNQLMGQLGIKRPVYT